MWAKNNSDNLIKKWALISSILMIVAIILPVPGKPGFFIWSIQEINHFEFRDYVVVLILLCLLGLPVMLRFLLSGKALSASLLAYCCIVQFALMEFLISPISNMASLYAFVNSMNFQSAEIRLISHLSMFGGITIVPVVLLLVVLGAAYYLSIKLPAYRYPFTLSSFAAWALIFICVIAFTNLYLEYPKEFNSLFTKAMWVNSWPLLTNILLLFTLCLAVLLQSKKKSPMLLVTILVKTFVFAGPIVLFIGFLIQSPESIADKIYSYLIVFAKIMAGLYAVYFLFILSLVTTIEQNTGVRQLKPSRSTRPAKSRPLSMEDTTLDDTLILQ